MKREHQPIGRTMAKPGRGRGLAALLAGSAAVDPAGLPDDVRAELRRMSIRATELLFPLMTYDEAREVMRHGWLSRYFAHLQKIAKQATL